MALNVVKAAAFLLLVSADAFVIHNSGFTVRTIRESSEGPTDELEALLRRAKSLVEKSKYVDSEVESSLREKRYRAGSTERRGFKERAFSDPRPSDRQVCDDSIGFLLEMKRKLDDDDYKRVFDQRNIKGLLADPKYDV